MLKKFLFLACLVLGSTSMTLVKSPKSDRSKRIGGDYDPIVVLELFTSQGCSSCPPADVLLDRAKGQDGVFALSYHVDYWNYIGWEDPFSDANFTKKQREYNRKFNYSGNYTPQMVINGQEHFVGSNAQKLTAKIEEYGRLKAENNIIVTTAERLPDGTVDLEFKVEGNRDNKLLRAVLVLDHRTTMVKRGENRDRTLRNSNIVVAESYVSLGNGSGKVSLKVPNWIADSEPLGLIVLVENEKLDITAATKAVL